MIRPGVLWTIARAEGRLTRRLVRYWVFLSVSWIFGVGAYLYYGLVLHRNFSSFGATFSILNPRYLTGIYGPYYLLVFMIGIVFLAFDVRSRDVRERIVEVLDAKPFSNVELVLGRYVGLMMLAWIPVVLISIFLGFLSAALHESIQPLSLFVFATSMAIPALTFTVGLVFLSSILVRFRWLGALLSIAILVGMVAAGVFLPIYATVLTDLSGGFQLGWPSDLVFMESGPGGVVQRFAVFFAGIGMMFLAAALYPRLDDGSRGRRLLTGAGVLAVAAVLFAVSMQYNRAPLERSHRYLAAHQARQDDPAPDLLSMNGNVRVDPGREVALDLTLRIAAPEERSLSSALFSLNPGITVVEMTDSSGEALEFSHEDGLLDVRLPGELRPTEEIDLHLVAEGPPDGAFSYLDAHHGILELKALDANLFILGFEPMIFTDDFVVLVPGVRWLPLPGSEIGRSDPGSRPPDYFTVDLTVDLPDGWLAAGPGRRRPVSPAPENTVAFRFAPPAPLPDVGLVASRFESRSAEIDGVLFEFLVHPVHAEKIDFFSDAAEEIRDRIAQTLEDAEALGLTYPYDAFTLVEVPNSFRSYGGGWRMDTSLAPPTMALVKEASFPTARFDVPFKNPDDFKDREGGIARAKMEKADVFFRNDFVGGNIHTAAARNFFVNQTAGRGPEGLPMNFVLETLCTRLVVGDPGYFSAHIFDRDFQQTIQTILTRFFIAGGPGGQISAAEAVVTAMTQRLEVWDAVLGISLVDLDPDEDPRRTVDVLLLKGDAMARSMLDGFGRQQVAQLLAMVRDHHQGETFTREELVAAADEIGIDLDPWMAVWFDETDLPGFVPQRREVFRLPDAEDGSPRYQVLLGLLNDESADGLLRVDYATGGTNPGASDVQRGQSDPIRVPGGAEIELGMVTSRPPETLTVVPYLSLNREPFVVELETVEEDRIVQAEPFRGVREVEREEAGDEIIVDDLDPGFSVVDEREQPWWRLGGRSEDEVTDQGLLSLEALRFRSPPDRWSRRVHRQAYGKYRHTLAAVKAGAGERRAIFEADLSRTGPWELELHLTWNGEQIPQLAGTLNLVIEDRSGRRDVTFSTAAAAQGWNSVGSFEIADGDVRVELSNDTDANLIIADAIRWTPAGGNDKEVASR